MECIFRSIKSEKFRYIPNIRQCVDSLSHNKTMTATRIPIDKSEIKPLRSQNNNSTNKRRRRKKTTTIQHNDDWLLALILVFLTCLGLLVFSSAHMINGNAGDYLYTDQGDDPHVIEFVRTTLEDGSFAPDTPQEFLPVVGSSTNSSVPRFLASPDNGDRLVLFYAPWCG